jgi:hypothetical protein
MKKGEKPKPKEKEERPLICTICGQPSCWKG